MRDLLAPIVVTVCFLFVQRYRMKDEIRKLKARDEIERLNKDHEDQILKIKNLVMELCEEHCKCKACRLKRDIVNVLFPPGTNRPTKQ